MVKSSFIFCLVLLLPVLVQAQTTPAMPCPTVLVDGRSDGKFDPRDIRFVARINANGWPGPFGFHWTASWPNPNTRERIIAKIDEGQGTSAIRILNPGNQITATVEAIGFPAGCTNTASEFVNWTPASEAIKIGELRPNDADHEINLIGMIVQTMTNNPTSQLYVLAGYKKDADELTVRESQDRILRSVVNHGLDAKRVTFRTIKAGTEIVQFWQVPAGATRPICQECGESPSNKSSPDSQNTCLF